MAQYSDSFPSTNSYIYWNIGVNEDSYNISGNYSVVTVTIDCWRSNSGYSTSGTGTVYVNINGSSYSASISNDQSITSSARTLFSKQVTIPHNDDGSKSLYVEANIQHSRFTTSTYGATFSLTTIPRASSIDSCTHGTYLTDAIITKWTPKTSSFSYKIRYSIPNVVAIYTTSAISPSSTSQQTKAYTFSTSNLNTIYSKASATSEYVQIGVVVETYSGSTKVGESSETTFNLKLPTTIVPSANLTLTDTLGHISTYGGYIQNKSTISVSASGSATYNASISSYSVSIEGSTLSSTSAISNKSITPTSAGSKTAILTVTDSRGRQKTASQSYTVYGYTAPTIIKLTASRCEEDGTAADDGNYISITYSYSATNINDNNINIVSATLKYKKHTDDDWTTISTSSDYSATDVTTSNPVEASADYQYDVALDIYDSLSGSSASPITKSISISTGFALMDFKADGDGIAIGKVSQTPDCFEVSEDWEVKVGLITSSKNIWSKRDDGAENNVGVENNSGQIYMYSHGTSSNGTSRGLFGKNTAGTYGNILSVDQSNAVTLFGAATSLTTTTQGTTKRPVYFSSGKPVACGIRWYYASTVVTLSAGSDSVGFLSASTLNSYFGVSNCGNTNTAVFVANGDAAASPHADCATYVTSSQTWYFCAGSTVSKASSYRVNWFAIYMG